MSELLDYLLEDKSYQNLLLAALSLTKKDFDNFLDSYLKDDQIVVYFKQKKSSKTLLNFTKHRNYIGHSVDTAGDLDYVIVRFSYPLNVQSFLESLDSTELSLPELWVELFK